MTIILMTFKCNTNMPSKLFLEILLAVSFSQVALGGFENFVKEHFPFSFGLCKYPQLNGYFRPDKFFIGNWYVRESHNSPFETKTKCLSIRSERSDSGEIWLYFRLNDPIKGASETVLGFTYMKYVQFSREIFPVTYKTSVKGQFSMAFSILDTDYDNWAVVYSCQQYIGYKHEMAWVLVRHEEDIQNDAIERTLNEVGLKIMDFDTHNYILCAQ